MNIYGKVLFFNDNEGKGIIITSDKKKFDFSVAEWNDFDNMPSLGLEVSFSLTKNIPTDIIMKSDEDVSSEPDNESSEDIEIREIEELNNEAELEKKSDETIEDDITLEENIAIEEERCEQEHKEVLSNEEEFIEKSTSVKEEAQKYLDDHNKLLKEEEKQQELEKEAIEAQKATEAAMQLDLDREKEELERVALDEERSSITITLNISTAVANYFDQIKEHVNKRAAYKKVDGRIEYALAKRFINTTFNNLTDIDLHIITPKIKALNSDLKEMGGVYEDFRNKTRHPHVAYKEVFLACQAEYMKVKVGAQRAIDKLKTLQANEASMGGMLKVKKEELDKNIKTVEFTALQHELKSLNGAYVDVVHMMAELDERYKNDMKLLSKFEDEYREDFYEVFGIESLIYKKKVLDILDSQAYIFDLHMWQEAKKSKAVKAHFAKSNIVGDMTTKTYLKYYLETLSSDKISEDQKKLFTLYEKLEANNPDYILIVMSSAQDVMEHENSIKHSCKTINVRSFIDEKSALKWAMKNSVKLIILEDRLQKTTAERFLHVYQKNIFLKPEVIILGQKPKASPFPIFKMFSKSISTKVIIGAIKEVIK
ncbi:hypothetical protein N9A28_02460 [Sulfurimonas sp.]|nr:hypothetical protein [Sulfurimonas sp.]